MNACDCLTLKQFLWASQATGLVSFLVTSALIGVAVLVGRRILKRHAAAKAAREEVESMRMPDDVPLTGEAESAEWWMGAALNTLNRLSAGGGGPGCRACAKTHDESGVCRVGAVRHGIEQALAKLRAAASGSPNLAALREELYSRAGAPAWPPFPNKYNPLAWVKEGANIGEGTWIGAFCLVDELVTLGRGCNLACGAHVLSHSTVRRCVTGRAYPEIDTAPTVLGDHVFVGEHATIMRGCRIGDRCVVGAGSLVLEHARVPSDCVVVGVPSRISRRLSPTALACGDADTACGCIVTHEEEPGPLHRLRGMGNVDESGCVEHGKIGGAR